MMDDSAPTPKRRKLVKTFKNVHPRKRIVISEVCGETYSKIDIKEGVDKRKNSPHIKGNAEREREIVSTMHKLSMIDLVIVLSIHC